MKLKIVTTLIILIGIISIHSGMALTTVDYVINSSGSIAFTQPLHVEGKFIKNEQNQIVYLRGANVGGWVDDYAGLWTPEGYYYGETGGQWIPSAVKAELDEMKSWGMTCVRSLLAVDWWLDNYMGYRDHYKDFVTWAGERGIYVIVGFWSLTHYEEGGWCESTAFPYPPYIPTEYEYLMPNEQAFIDLWDNVAYEFRDYTNVLFDLWNEVGHQYVEDPIIMNDWWATVDGCINAIRQHSNAIVILIQSWGIDWDWNWSTEPGGYVPYATMEWIEIYRESLPTDPNIIFDTHIYRDHGSMGSNHPVEGYPYTYDTIKEALNNSKIKWVLDTINRPMNIGEVGANLYAPPDGHEIEAFMNTLAVFNEWGLNYQAWIWIPENVNTMYPLLAAGPHIPPPSAAGQILIDALAVT